MAIFTASVRRYSQALFSVTGRDIIRGRQTRARLTICHEKIYSTDDPVLCGYLKSVLLNEGVTCVVRNEHLPAGAGEIPFTECWPELWVIEDRDITRSQKLLQAVLSAPQVDDVSWTCAACGESGEAQFTACWKCGEQR